MGRKKVGRRKVDSRYIQGICRVYVSYMLTDNCGLSNEITIQNGKLYGAYT